MRYNEIIAEAELPDLPPDWKEVDRTIPDDDEPDVKSKFHNYTPRGGFTVDKIKKQMRSNPGISSGGNFEKLYNDKGRSTFAREIRNFSSPEEFADHLYWHGSGNYVDGGLKPGALMPKGTDFGGGYDEPYHTISLSKSKNMASNFTGQSRHGSVYPVLLRKGAKVISMPGITDSQELEDILTKLWERKIDAVKVGDWKHPSSEQEICIVNPRAIVRGGPEYFAVFNKKKFEEPTMDEITAIYDQAKNPPAKNT